MEPANPRIQPRDIILAVKVIPKAAKNEIVGWEGQELKIKIRAIPDKGKANDMLVHFLAEVCDVGLSQIKIISGETSRHKRVKISGYRQGLPDNKA